MAAVQNERDKLLQAASPRVQTVDSPASVLNPNTRGVQVSASASVFSVDKFGVPSPSETTLTAKLTSFPANHPVVWSVVSGTATLTQVTSASATLAYSDMVSTSTTVRATSTYLASVYAEDIVISKVFAGEDGVSPDTFAVKPSATSLLRDALGNLSQPLITFSAYRRVGVVGTLEPYAGRIQVRCLIGTNWVANHTPSADAAVVNFTVPAGAKDVFAALFRAGGLTEELDRSNVPVLEDGVDIDVHVESTNGTVFRVGQARQTMLVARVFRNGVDITDTVPASRFRWVRVSMDNPLPPNDDAAWNANYASGFKQILVDVDQVFAKATFHCQIIE